MWMGRNRWSELSSLWLALLPNAMTAVRCHVLEMSLPPVCMDGWDLELRKDECGAHESIRWAQASALYLLLFPSIPDACRFVASKTQESDEKAVVPKQ